MLRGSIPQLQGLSRCLLLLLRQDGLRETLKKTTNCCFPSDSVLAPFRIVGSLRVSPPQFDVVETLAAVVCELLNVKLPITKWNSSASLMKLYLDSVNATGRIPESFGHLTSLRTLILPSCNLSGFIPKPLCNLNNIEVLDLAYNQPS
ncbi:hypothetical protein RDI58_000316 [Solanum bulbocastanum]|uniref:Disease resistance protein n=1 Tax=Solanum bulbocastanum TaxID=147425 RepID=A0AAN8UBR6_SOLBU